MDGATVVEGRVIEVIKSSNHSITFHLWDVSGHSADDGFVKDITVKLKNAHGKFNVDYQYAGNKDLFEGTIDIIDSGTIRINCSNDCWGDNNSYIFIKND